MKSTGEVYGSDERADLAYLKARLATEVPVATEGGAYLTVRDEDKENLVPVAQELVNIGFNPVRDGGNSRCAAKARGAGHHRLPHRRGQAPRRS